jgi:flagellar motor switch protein FliG
MRRPIQILPALLALLAGLFPAQSLFAGTRDQVAASASRQVRTMIEPLLERYCQADGTGLPSCKLLQVSVDVELDTGAAVTPGFDDVDPRTAAQLAPIAGKIKLLVDEKIGPVSRAKLVEIVEQYLETLEFPVSVDVKVASFPQPLSSVGRVASIRQKITDGFKETLEGLFRQFCPDQCLLGEFNLDAEAVNPEEAQYGPSGEFVQEGTTAVRINEIAATILIDESLGAEEQANLLEMARLRTGGYKNVTLASKVLRFPQGPNGAVATGEFLAGLPGGRLKGRTPAGLALSALNEKTDSTTSSSTQNSSLNSETSNSTTSANSELKDSRIQTTDSSLASKSAQDSKSTTQETSAKQERFERIEKIERVENGDAVQRELRKFKLYGVVFAALVLSMLTLIAITGFRASGKGPSILPAFLGAPASASAASHGAAAGDLGGALSPGEERVKTVAVRYEIQRLVDELSKVFAESPRVAKVVFSRILTEEGVETTAAYMQIFGEAIVVDMLRDPSLQSDLNELTEFYAKNPLELGDDDQLDLLRRLHNRTVAGKLVVMGNRSSNIFDFLVEMDGLQIFELLRNESMTVKAIVSTQCDPQKRNMIFQQLGEDSKLQLMAELSRIDYLPRDYVYNVAQALKRKRRDNPKLNTEALPGSEVLVGLLEKTGEETQRSVMKSLEVTHPDSARMIRGKLVSVDTLRYLRDGQLLEVVLSLKHDELLQFLKGAAAEVRSHIFSKAPKDLAAELEEEIGTIPPVSREGYQAVERKILNRMKVMANEGLINLNETNERMFAGGGVSGAKVVNAVPDGNRQAVLRRVS